MALPPRVQAVWNRVFGPPTPRSYSREKMETLGWIMFLCPIWVPFFLKWQENDWGYQGSPGSAVFFCFVGYVIIRLTRLPSQEDVVHSAWTEKDEAHGTYIARCDCGWQGEYYGTHASALDQALDHGDDVDPGVRTKPGN